MDELEEVPRRADYLGPAVRRPLVLDAACSVFAEAGFGAASMSQIARKAGITKPVLYSCFPGGKQEIILTLLDREEERVMDHLRGVLSMTRRMPVGEGIRLGIKAYLDYASIHPDSFKLLNQSPGTWDAEVQARADKITEAIVDLMGERAAELAGSIGADPVVGEALTRSIVAIANMLGKWWARDRPMPLGHLSDLTSALIMKGLEGMLPADVLARGVQSTQAAE